MRKGNIEDGNYPFSYRENPTMSFNNRNFIIVVKDEDFPDKNVVPVVYCSGSNVRDVDQEDMHKIFVSSNQVREQSAQLEDFKNNFQVLKISYGTIVSNDRYLNMSNYPKCRTYASNLHSMSPNDFAEIFEGDIDISKSTIKIKNIALESLLIEVYAEDRTPIMILNKGVMIGPFRVIGKGENGNITVEKTNWKTFGEYAVTEQSFIEFTHFSLTRRIFVSQVNRMDIRKMVDFKDDKDIINDFILRIGENVFNKQRQKELQEFLKEVSSLQSVEKYIENNNRLKQILSDSEKVLISDADIANFIPQMSVYLDRINTLEQKKNSIEKELKSKVAEINEIDNLILEKRKNINILETESIEKERRKKEEIEELENKINALNKEKEILNGFILEFKKEGKEVQKETLRNLVEIANTKIYRELLDNKGTFGEEEEKKEFKDYSVKDAFENYIDFRNALMDVLNRNGRNFDVDFIDNLLISIHQNTLTIFAGLPGVGKTSLSKLITKIMSPKERIKEVSVGRGWTSQKDFIGFQNPLNNKFYSAPTGVYELLNQLDKECEEGSYLESPMAYVILDEANLSPIEHYWSCFYNLTDSIARDGEFLSIKLGNNCQVRYANNLRFIATINYDQTTENLSPRVIDRANIIQIPNNNFNINGIFENDIERLNISYRKCIEFFKLFDFSDGVNFENVNTEVEEIFEVVKNKFKEFRMPISPRVEIAIKRYSLACECVMDSLKGLDYCIAQRILPIINLQGEGAKKNLEELRIIFAEKGLEKSWEILNNILEIGGEDGIFEGSYNYFLTLSYA